MSIKTKLEDKSIKGFDCDDGNAVQRKPSKVASQYPAPNVNAIMPHRVAFNKLTDCKSPLSLPFGAGSPSRWAVSITSSSTRCLTSILSTSSCMRRLSHHETSARRVMFRLVPAHNSATFEQNIAETITPTRACVQCCGEVDCEWREYCTRIVTS